MQQHTVPTGQLVAISDLEIVNARVHNLATEEELRHEIEQQKRFFLEQHGKEQDDEQ